MNPRTLEYRRVEQIGINHYKVDFNLLALDHYWQLYLPLRGHNLPIETHQGRVILT